MSGQYIIVWLDQKMIELVLKIVTLLSRKNKLEF